MGILARLKQMLGFRPHFITKYERTSVLVEVHQTVEAPWEFARDCPEKWLGRYVIDISTYCGTYGMGGPGFLGLQTSAGWLMCRIWGCAAWLATNDYDHIEAENADQVGLYHCYDGTTDDHRKALTAHLQLPACITAMVFLDPPEGSPPHHRGFRVEFDNGRYLMLDPLPSQRRNFLGVPNQRRELAPSDRLEDAFIFSPSPAVSV